MTYKINYGRYSGKIHAMYIQIKFKYVLNPHATFHFWAKHGDFCLINIDTMSEKDFTDILKGYR